MTVPTQFNYGADRASLRLCAELEEGDDREAVQSLLYNSAKTFVLRSVRDLHEVQEAIDRDRDGFFELFFGTENES